MNLFSFFTHSYHFKSIDSTQLFLKSHYETLSNMSFVRADYQTMGRGRNSRTWVSEKNTNLLFSFLIKDEKSVQKYSTLSLLTAVCIKKALDGIGIKNVYIKWPNDVFVNDKKICGILLEGIMKNSKLIAIAVGVGLNVNQINFPNNLLNKPTSIALERKRKIDINKIRKIIFKIIKKEFKNIDQSNYLTIARESNYLKDKNVYAEIDNEKKLVKVLDINADNSLKVLLDDKIIDLTTGEITFHI